MNGGTMQRKIERWIEKLPPETVQIVLRGGDDRRTESILERWNIEDIANIPDNTIELLESEQQGRLIAYDERSKQLRAITIRTEQAQQATSDTGMLVEGILRMAEEQRRFVATITDSFQVMHETIQDALYKERDHQEEITELQLALALEQAQNANDEPSTADKALGVITQVLESKRAISDPVGMAKNLLSSHPEIIDSLLADETIVEMITKKIVS
jgi:hypothetical protein